MGQDRRNKIKKEIKDEEKFTSGEGTIGGSAPDQESEEIETAGGRFKAVVGHEPDNPAVDEDGTTLAEEVEAAEGERRGRPGHEEPEE